MLSKDHRLTRAAFNQVFQNGRRIHSPLVTAIVVPSSTLAASVVVGKKVYKKAVDRNRLRRRVYGVIERVLLPTYQGKVIIIIKPLARTLSHAEFKVQLETFLARIDNSR